MALAAFDALWTTLALKDAGPVTGRLARGIWMFLLRIHRIRRSHRLLTFGGTLIVLATLGFWLVAFWIGWTLVFASDPGAVVHARTGAEASFLDRLYFAGFSLTTLGVGDFVPMGGWKVATVLSAGSGLVLITLSITYFVPVLNAVIAGRTMATLCAVLGGSPRRVVHRAWTQDRLDHLETTFHTIAVEIHQHTHRHHGYPVIHYFHAPASESSVPLRIAVLDEALTLIEYGIKPDAQPDPEAVRAVRKAVDGYLAVVSTVYIDDKEAPPPLPDLGPLREAGLATVDEGAFAEAVAELRDRRSLLHAIVRHDGWTWSDVVADADFEPLEPIMRHE